MAHFKKLISILHQFLSVTTYLYHFWSCAQNNIPINDNNLNMTRSLRYHWLGRPFGAIWGSVSCTRTFEHVPGAGDRTADPLIRGWPAVPCTLFKISISRTKTVKIRSWVYTGHLSSIQKQTPEHIKLNRLFSWRLQLLINCLFRNSKHPQLLTGSHLVWNASKYPSDSHPHQSDAIIHHYECRVGGFDSRK